MVELLSLLAFIVITYILFDRLLRRLKVGGYSEKYVVVTGCDSGFGQRLAIRLDKLEFNVFAGCLTEDGRLYLSQNCSKRVVPFLLDIRNDDSIQAAFDLVNKSLPKDTGLWGLVNNAGVLSNMCISELCSKKDYLASMEVNLFGLIEMTRTFLPLIRKSRGRVINTSSAAGRIALFAPVYTVSKYGVEAYSDIVRREMYAKGVRVVLVEPGSFKTSLTNVEKTIQIFQNAYDSASEELKSVFKGYIEKFHNRLIATPLSTNIDLVVDAYIHGLTSRFPRTRYAVGLDCLLGCILMSYLPTRLTDWLFQH